MTLVFPTGDGKHYIYGVHAPQHKRNFPPNCKPPTDSIPSARPVLHAGSRRAWRRVRSEKTTELYLEESVMEKFRRGSRSQIC